VTLSLFHTKLSTAKLSKKNCRDSQVFLFMKHSFENICMHMDTRRMEHIQTDSQNVNHYATEALQRMSRTNE